MRLDKHARLNCSRFGCTLLLARSLICIPWQHDAESARSAEIRAQILLNKYPSAPLLSLAFQISRSRVLPYYCYVPFDIRKEAHVKYLSGILNTGKIQVSLLTTPRSILRTHEIPAGVRAAMAKLLENAVAHSHPIAEGSYDFECAVAEFEQKVRLTDYFQYVLTGPELRQLVQAFERGGAKSAPDQKAHAEKMATELLRVFWPRHEELVLDFMKHIPSIRRSLLFMSDLHDYFHNDFDGLRKFVVDAIASHAPKEENLKFEEQIPLLELLVSLSENVRKPDVSGQQTSAARDAELSAIAKRITTEGLSLEKLKNLASIFGFQGGQPGRPKKDYSEEYELRARGRKWREVAEHLYQNDPDIRREYDANEFVHLTSTQKFALMHRVREGIRAYAKREGKPFPSRHR